MAYFDPAVQVHSCYLNKPQEKIHRNFDNTLELVDLWLANETTFEETKDNIKVAAKDKDLYLTRSDLLRDVFFMDPLKADLMKIVLFFYQSFFSFNFLSLYLFSLVSMASTSS